jgi:MFS family permease
MVGLLCTVVALAGIALAAWPFWLVGGTLAGFGLGLRWIGLEPWLYRIAPAEARGRLVGFHETLIALAPIVAPVLASTFGLHGMALFWIGGVFTLAALFPLALASKEPEHVASEVVPSGSFLANIVLRLRERVFQFGAAIALVGGMMEAALSGLFALFTQGRGITGSQTTDLLALFGLGGLLLQYAVGWLADHRGVGVAAFWCAIGTALVCVALALPMGYTLVMFAVFLLGGFITAFLTLALISSTMTQSGSMASNVSLISMLYTLSAVAGPLIAGAAMKATGTDALMWSIATAALVLMGVLVWINRARQSPLA